MPVVHFDEAGNTGAALLDPSQPVFALASSDFTAEEATELLGFVRTPQTQEVKFSTLKRSAPGRRRVLDFLNSPLLAPQRVKVSVCHKRHMAMCKAIDIIEEPLAHRAGIDLYERGANIATANLHFFLTPMYCGEERFQEFLASFVEMVRFPSPQTKARFFAAARALYDNCTEPRHRSSFAPYIVAEREIDELLENVTYLAMDPALGDVFHQLSAWGTQFGGEFAAVHDQSKPIWAEREALAEMMDPVAEPTLIGYDRRKFEFPLRASRLDFADSAGVPQLQVVDLLAGAVCHFGSAMARSTRDEFTDALDAAGIERFTIQALWPELAVSPKDLGTEEVGGINATDFMAEALFRRRKEKR